MQTDAATQTAAHPGVVGADEVVGPLTLEIGEDGTTVRAILGRCLSKEPVKVWVGDAPETVAPVTGVELAEVRQALVAADGDVTLLGSDADCVPTEVTSDDHGATWQTRPIDAATSAAPGSLEVAVADSRCTPRLVSKKQGETNVFCTDGAVMRIGDDDRGQGVITATPNSADFAIDGEEHVVVSQIDNACKGQIQMLPLTQAEDYTVHATGSRSQPVAADLVRLRPCAAFS